MSDLSEKVFNCRLLASTLNTLNKHVKKRGLKKKTFVGEAILEKVEREKLGK